MSLDWLVPGLRLAEPWALALLLLLPVWYLGVGRAHRRRGGLTFPVAALGDLPRSWRLRLQPLPELLRLLVLASLILALARPQLGREEEKITQEGVDIMLALDVSASMLAEDIQPNRMEAAKATIGRFARKVRSDRVGLVVFAGRSFTQCPLTTDYGTLLELVRETHINMVGFDGTAIGDALANCVYRFEREAERRAGEGRPGGQPKKPRSRVIVLLTDGFNNTGSVVPRKAAELARQKNIRIHAIGLGALEGAPIPYYRSGRRVYLQSPDGSLLIARLDEPNLQEIAAVSGGQYFRATDAAALDRIYDQIGAMEKHEIEIKHLTRYEERFLIPTAIALGLLLLELLLRSTVLRISL